MVKVVKEYNLADEITNSNARRARRGLRPITLDMMHKNQHPHLAQHLKYDTAHRMLDRFKAAPRNTPVSFVPKESLADA